MYINLLLKNAFVNISIRITNDAKTKLVLTKKNTRIDASASANLLHTEMHICKNFIVSKIALALFINTNEIDRSFSNGVVIKCYRRCNKHFNFR